MNIVDVSWYMASLESRQAPASATMTSVACEVMEVILEGRNRTRPRHAARPPRMSNSAKRFIGR